MKDPLFTPIRINQLEIPNRIYMPAMHLGMASDFQVTDSLVAFYERRARGGAGMICVGYATVDDMSGSTLNIGAHDDAFIPGLSRLAAAINDSGSRSAVQLNHAGRYNWSFFLDGRQPVAPSAVASRMTRETPRALEIDDIRQIIDHFAAAAGRVKAAGFHAVEVLSGTGYLLSEFLSPLTNQRTDDYGGILENRMRFGLEVMRAIRETVGPDYPVMVRMNGNDFMEGGQDKEELKVYAEHLVADAGVDALCINVGWHEARVPQIVTSVPRGVFAYLSRDIRERVGVPVIASHRINDPVLARDLIADGMCDMVAMGRSLIADPDLPEKARTGREAEIVHCIACAQGCFDNLFKLKSVECMCNPQAGRELDTRIEKAERRKTVMVVGGGPAGMSAALAAAARGHRVTLCESAPVLGGQLFLAAAPPGREEFAALARDLAVQVNGAGIEVVTNKTVTAADIREAAPDAVILATGATPLVPPIPGIDHPHVVQAWDVLAGRATTGRRVVIIGGGAVGVETALYLAEKGTLDGDAVKFLMIHRAEPAEEIYRLATRGTKEITLIEMIDKVGKDIGKSTRWTMLQDMDRVGIQSNVSTTALEISETGVRVDTGSGIKEIPADTVVIAAGSASYHPLKAELDEMDVETRLVGDARQVALALDAVHGGFEAGRSL